MRATKSTIKQSVYSYLLVLTPFLFGCIIFVIRLESFNIYMIALFSIVLVAFQFLKLKDANNIKYEQLKSSIANRNISQHFENLAALISTHDTIPRDVYLKLKYLNKIQEVLPDKSPFSASEIKMGQQYAIKHFKEVIHSNNIKADFMKNELPKY